MGCTVVLVGNGTYTPCVRPTERDYLNRYRDHDVKQESFAIANKDIVHAMPNSLRREYLLDGYVRILQQQVTTLCIPRDIRMVCASYLEEITVESLTEKRWRLMAVSEECAVCLFGARNAGKTQILYRLLLDEFRTLTEYDATIEAPYTHEIVVDGAKYVLDILDTYDPEPSEGTFCYHHCLRNYGDFIIFYSVMDRRSFEFARELYQFLWRCYDGEKDEVPIILCGHITEHGLAGSHREVSYDDGATLAKEWNVPFLETCAKTGENVHELFQLFIHERNWISSWLHR